MKIVVRIPIAKRGVVVHRNKKGKGSYTRKGRGKPKYEPCIRI